MQAYYCHGCMNKQMKFNKKGKILLAVIKRISAHLIFRFSHNLKIQNPKRKLLNLNKTRIGKLTTRFFTIRIGGAREMDLFGQ